MPVFEHEEADFSITISINNDFYSVRMTLNGETIQEDGIKFIMDEEYFSEFTYDDWVNYFTFMREEWEMVG